MSLEPIDYTAHARDIETQYLKVVTGSDPETTWLIISPNANKQYGPDLVGNDFGTFLQSFEDTKVQYGLARVSPPGSDVQKLILIGWCPDAAPMKSRASFASNFGLVSNQLLKGYHVQVTARDEDDLDENELLMKISNAAGARYSIQNKSTTAAPSSSAKPTVKRISSPATVAPAPSATTTPKKISNTNIGERDEEDDDDWDEPEVEERDLDKNPLKPNQSSYKPIGKIDLKKVIAEEKAKEDPRLVVKPQEIERATSPGEKINPLDDIANLKQKSKLQRENEIDSFLNNNKSNVNNPKIHTPDERRVNKDSGVGVIKGFSNEKSPAQIWAEKKAAAAAVAAAASTPETTNDINASTTTSLDNTSSPNINEDEEHDVHDLKSKFENLATEGNEFPIIKPKKVAPSSAFNNNTSDEITPPKRDIKSIGNPLPGMHHEISEDDDNNNNDDDWSDEEDDREMAHPVTRANPLPPRQITPEPEQEKIEEPSAPSLPSRNAQPPSPSPQEEEEEEEEEEAPALPSRNTQPPSPSPQEEQEEAPALPSRGGAAPETAASTGFIPPPPPKRNVQPEPETPWAIAEYDYDAGEDNELTFQENDKIINIEFVDDDWWLGELDKSGEKGLFPSNYVALNGN